MIDVNDGGKLRPEEYATIQQQLGAFAASRIAKEEQMLVDPIDWFRATIGTHMWRFVLTHPDKDHMSGIRRLLSESREIDVLHFWDYDHTRTRTERDYPYNPAGWLDWRWYEGFHHQRTWEGVTWPKRIHPLRGDTGNFWTDDSLEILSPSRTLIADCDARDEYNDSSYVIKISHGRTSRALAPGDVEDKGWNEMIEAGLRLRANVLVASHHGRNSGYSERALDLIRPEVVIISSDEIPAKEDAIDKYKRRAQVFSTREHGTLTVRMHDGGDLEILDTSSGTRLASFSDPPPSTAR
jgi:beta-lactamase superfamily II metal-dependent hydrolase